MLAGYVLGDKTRHTIFMDIAGGHRNLSSIARRHHIPYPRVERAASELKEKGLVSDEGELRLTDLGEKVLHEVKRRAKSAGKEHTLSDKRANVFRPDHWN